MKDETELKEGEAADKDVAGIAKAAFLEGWHEGHSQGLACGHTLSGGCRMHDGQDGEDWEISDIRAWLQSLCGEKYDPRDMATLGGDPTI